MSEPAQRQRIYLDFNASRPASAKVSQSVAEALLVGGNPSSPHREGRAARALLEAARRRVACALKAETLDVTLCSGGTEANHLGLMGLARAARAHDAARIRVLLPPSVHPSLMAAGEALQAEGFALEILASDPIGRIDMEDLDRRALDRRVAVLACSLVNHELGTLQPIGPLLSRAREHAFFLFGDAVQALGRVPLDVCSLGLDGLSISAHKIGGPQGVGALWLASGIDVHALVGGGKQESARRPGTQATALAAGFAAAVDELDSDPGYGTRLEPLWYKLRSGLVALGALMHSSDDLSITVSNTLAGRFPGVSGDLLVASLDLAGVAISTGAACSSGMATPSSGLLGIGLSKEEALQAFRISMGPQTRAEEIEVLLEVLPAILERAKRF